MFTKTSMRSIAAWMLFATAVFTLQGCSKKDSGDDNSTNPDFYLTATVDGKAWSANVKAPDLNNSPSIASVTNANGVSLVLLLGLHAQNKDTTAIALVFPKNIQLNKAFNFDASQYLEGAYVASTSPGASTYNGYNTTPATGGSGTITVTRFDNVANVIEGSFSGIFGSQTDKAPVTITNGKFRCVYTTSSNPLPSSGLKF